MADGLVLKLLWGLGVVAVWREGSCFWTVGTGFVG